MSDMRASAAAEVAADLIRSAAALWAKRAAILDGVTTQADRAEVHAAEATAARAAAKSMAGDLRRRQATFSCSIPGNPTARAGAPLTFLGCRPGVDGLPFIIKSATHSFSKGGYTTELSGESQSGPKGGKTNE